MAIVADSNNGSSDGRGAMGLSETSASLTVTNGSNGNAHGVNITQSATTISGGTTSTTLTLDDSGATFADTTTGGPARVTGIADGVNPYDAVNVRQFRAEMDDAYAGIASAAALAAIPEPAAGRKYSLGIGLGNFKGESAFGAGFKASIQDNIKMNLGIAHSRSSYTTSAGVGFSW